MTPADEGVAYFYALGRALAAWSRLEAKLFKAAVACFHEENHPSLAVGFVKIQGFRNKLSFADGTITRAFHGTEFVEEWTAIFDKVRSASYKRNDLAHFQSGEFPLNEEGRRWALCPWITRKGRDKTKPPDNSYCVRDLVILELEFNALTVQIANFAARARGQKEPFPKSDEQPDNPPTIQQIARLIHAELGHPQKSSREKRLEDDEKNAAASLLAPDGELH